MANITAVKKGSIAKELGLEVGDILVGFNNQALKDSLDFYYYDSQEQFTMNIISKQGNKVDLEINKFDYESIGIELDDSLDLTPMRCKNKCIFCFVDQMPKDMRDTLYVKDDDYRLSFASGSYVTLTNCFEEELQRIVALNLSPLYISVHCYDPETKVKMIGNPEGAKLFDKMQYLAENGINMHAQIVLCKGINDGEILKQTLMHLNKLMPHILSVAIIPVGLTKFRKGLFELQPIDKQTASDVIDIVEGYNKKVGGSWCLCSDELYLIAQRQVPSYDKYGSFGQIEDGVGLCADFCQSFQEAFDHAKVNKKKGEATFITGVSFANTLINILNKCKYKFPNFDAKVQVIQNDYFGRTITVAGLITAQDILAQLKQPSKHTIIPANMLREFSDTFLDGTTVVQLQKKLNSKIHVSCGGADIIKIINEVLK